MFSSMTSSVNVPALPRMQIVGVRELLEGYSPYSANVNGSLCCGFTI